MRFIISCTLCAVTVTVCAVTVAPVALSASESEVAPPWVDLAQELIREAIPDDYADTKKWGMQREVPVGVKVRVRGLNVRISKREKSVNHGTWRKYQAKLVDPEETFSFDVRKWRLDDDGKYRFTAIVKFRTRCTAKVARWNLGVQAFATNAEADADVEMQADCTVGLTPEVAEGELLPTIVLDPHVDDIRLRLRNIDVRRIGTIGGSLAREMGDESREFVEHLLTQQEERVKKKANQQIDKKRDRLRFSPHNALKDKWLALAEEEDATDEATIIR